LNYLEIKYISYYNAVNSQDFYNIADGGKSGNAFAGKTKEEMKNIKEKMSQKPISIDTRKILSQKAKERLRLKENHPMFGKHHTKETKEKLTKSHVGLNMKENNHNYGKHLSKETREKISSTLLGNIPWNKGKKDIYDANTINKMSKNRKGQCMHNTNANIKIICVDTNEIFDSAMQAQQKYNVQVTNISAVCKGKRKTACGYRWMYYEDYIKQQETA
jgi:hypothetical protein